MAYLIAECGYVADPYGFVLMWSARMGGYHKVMKKPHVICIIMRKWPFGHLGISRRANRHLGRDSVMVGMFE